MECIQISCKKSLILDVSAIERSVLGGNVSWDLKMVSTTERCPREVSATWRFYYESLTVISSVPEKGVCCREVSAIKDVCYKEVSL